MVRSLDGMMPEMNVFACGASYIVAQYLEAHKAQRAFLRSSNKPVARLLLQIVTISLMHPGCEQANAPG